MITGPVTLYDAFAVNISSFVILSSDTLKVTLHTSSYTPSAAHDEYADLTNELSTANGYTNGGLTLTTVTWTQTSGLATLDSDNAVWTPSGGAITARYAVLRSSTSTNQKLIGYVLLDPTPADISRSSPNQFVVVPDPTTGWFTATVNP